MKIGRQSEHASSISSSNAETIIVRGRDLCAELIGRTSFTLEHRITAPKSERGEARLVATDEAVQVLYDYAANRPRPIPDDVVVKLEAYEGRSLRA